MTDVIEWEDASTATYTAVSAQVAGFTVIVCEDDEGPLRPAFYWDILNDHGKRVTDGWASSVARAKRDAVATAKRMAKEGR
jgi:hypothetical protein